MKLDDFISKLTLALQDPSYYLKGGWGKYNLTTNKWGWDCVCLIKGILWGWNADILKPRGGGAVYASNNVPDLSTEQIIGVCHDISQDFVSIQIGELVWMKGHVGIYVGDGVIEATTAWNTKKVIKTQIGNNGERIYNGKTGTKKWKKHGFLPYVDYGEIKPINNWETGKYKLLADKAIRKTPKITATNIVKAKNCTEVTKKHLASQTGNAMLRAGTIITCNQIVKDGNRLFGTYGNCWICIRNKDLTPQAIKVD